MSTLFLFSYEITDDDCRDMGWSEHQIKNGLVADVDYVIAFKTDDPYCFLRTITNSHYEELTNCLLRGERRNVFVFWH